MYNNVVLRKKCRRGFFLSYAVEITYREGKLGLLVLPYCNINNNFTFDSFQSIYCILF